MTAPAGSRLLVACELLVKRRRDLREHIAGCLETFFRSPLKDALDRGLDGPLGLHVQAPPCLTESQERTTSVARIGLAQDERLLLHALQDARERARVNVEESCKGSCRDPREAPDDTED